MPPTIPINHYLSSRNRQNRTEVLSYYSMLMYSRRNACSEHSNFLKVKVLDTAPHSQVQERSPGGCPKHTRYTPEGWTGRPKQKSNYELFNRNNFNIRYWSWNYRGCWHQTCPPIDTDALQGRITRTEGL